MGITFGTNGNVGFTIGNTRINSNGTVDTKLGNSIISSDDNVSTDIGGFRIGSDGSSSWQLNDTTRMNSDGSMDFGSW